MYEVHVMEPTPNVTWGFAIAYRLLTWDSAGTSIVGRRSEWLSVMILCRTSSLLETDGQESGPVAIPTMSGIRLSAVLKTCILPYYGKRKVWSDVGKIGATWSVRSRSCLVSMSGCRLMAEASDSDRLCNMHRRPAVTRYYCPRRWE